MMIIMIIIRTVNDWITQNLKCSKRLFLFSIKFYQNHTNDSKLRILDLNSSIGIFNFVENYCALLLVIFIRCGNKLLRI